jgi:hypothetical protein
VVGFVLVEGLVHRVVTIHREGWDLCEDGKMMGYKVVLSFDGYIYWRLS